MAEEASHHLQLGHAARTAGRASEALGHYRRAVELEPGNAEAQSVYGLMLLNLGRTGDAEGPLRRAVEIAPRHPALRMNLAQWLAQAGRLDEALAIVSAVAEEEPQHWWAWARLGDLQLRKGAGAAAAGAFERAVRLRPEDGELVVKLAAAWRAAGHAAEADRVLGEAGAQVRARVASLRGDAAAQARRGNWSALERTAEAWAAAAPRDADAWRTLAMAQWELARYRRAMLSSARALEVGGRDAAALAAHARFCLQALEFDAAGRALAEAEALDAGLPALLTAKAQFLMLAGRPEEAIAYARRAIARNARDVAAYATLTELTGGRLDAGERRRLEELCGDASLRIADRAAAAFALAACSEATEPAPAAFAACERANRIAAEHAASEGIAYDRAARAACTDEIIARFGAVPAMQAGAPGAGLVFIVGMPRSGTTLIEGVIAAHPRVLGCGERPEMRWILGEWLAHARAGAAPPEGSEAWNAWRRQYEEGIPPDAARAVATDKNPWNFDAIGLIARLFPGARIIHVRRSPLDTGLSIYRHAFGKDLAFTTSLADIGHYYAEYARLMAHWERVAAGRFTTVRYEEFVRDFDAAGPALLAACGLEWTPECARFWENRRVIATMSTMQARQPPKPRPGRSERYARELAPLANALAAGGVDPETGALRTAAS